MKSEPVMRALKWLIIYLMKIANVFLVTLVFLTACLSKKTSTPISSMSFDKQGHRGCRGLMPENTIPAMIKALELGVTTLEMDAVITKDRHVVLSHEPFFNHEITTKPDGSYVSEAEEKSLNIFNFSYEEVRSYDVGMKPHPRFPRQQKLKAVKPLLSELIDSVEVHCRRTNRTPVFYNIETKSNPATDNSYHPAPEEFVDLLMKVILEKKIENRVIIQSFDFRTLQVMHRKYPRIQTAMLIEDYDKRTLNEQLNELQFSPSIYSPEQSHVTEQLIKACHDKKMKIIPWTVNEKAGIERLRSMGVDGIITDYPDLF
jgi:glycerophosphoryl diester phosphodiesterase